MYLCMHWCNQCLLFCKDVRYIWISQFFKIISGHPSDGDQSLVFARSSRGGTCKRWSSYCRPNYANFISLVGLDIPMGNVLNFQQFSSHYYWTAAHVNYTMLGKRELSFLCARKHIQQLIKANFIIEVAYIHNSNALSVYSHAILFVQV